jgi:SHS family lactate transporter-like MFS transporter
MFMIGVLPAFLVLYIRRHVPESPSFKPSTAGTGGTWKVLKTHWRRGLYAIVLMTAFNFFSHGTQDLYPTFLQVQRHLSTHVVGIIAIVYNIGAILGGILYGTISERIGRRRAILIAAVLSLPMVPLWATVENPVFLVAGAFLMQFMVQGAWGVIPVHLNELSPDEARGTFPGVVYQLGNLLAAINAPLQARIAAHYGGNYSIALALVAVVVAIAIAALMAFGIEAKGVAFGRHRPVSETPPGLGRGSSRPSA